MSVPKLAAFCCLLLALGLSACERGADETATDNHLRVGVVALPPGLGNPYSSTGVPTVYTWSAIFDPLTFVTEGGDILPWLATSWEALDETTWRFDLRKDVLFHNGKPFNAAAVVAAVDYVTSPAGRRESVAREVSALKSAEALNDYSVLIKTDYPARTLPGVLSMLPIVEPSAWAELGRDGFAQAPVGTGPFKLVRWTDAGAQLEGFKEGWHPPKADKLTFLTIPDSTARVQAIQSGKIDVAVSISPDYVPLLEKTGGTGQVGKTASVLGVAFILTQLPPGHPLHSQKVRQALNYAVNKRAYIKALFDDATGVASQPSTPGLDGHVAELKPYPYNPGKAKQLLAAAGYPDGFQLTMEVFVGGGAGDEASYQSVAMDLRRVGLDIKLHQIPVPRLIQNIQSGSWVGNMFPMNYNADRTADAMRFMKLHSCMLPNPWFCDEALTAQMKTARATWDEDLRRERVEAIMRRLHEDPPAIWLHEIFYMQGAGKRVRNFQQHMGWIRYDLIALDGEKMEADR